MKEKKSYKVFSRNNQKKLLKFFSPENIYVQLFNIEPPNVRPTGYSNRYLTIR